MSTTDAVIDQALRAAVRAPSVHNTQPWQFVVAPPFVELHLDRDRVLPVADPVAGVDGVPRSAGGPRPAGGTLLTPRQYPPGATTERPFEQDPLVAMLTATVVGLSASFLSQPAEVPSTRGALRTLLGTPGQPRTVLRIGYGQPVSRTPRRPVSAVTTVRAGVPS